MRTLLKAALLATTLAAAVPAVALAQPAPPPYPPVPPPRVEIVPPPHGDRMAWEPGHWQWDGRQYVWIAGHYIERHEREAHYVPGHWEQRFGHWEWVPAHWA